MTNIPQYFDIDNVTNLTKEYINDIFIVHLNAVSLVANFDKICLFLENIRFPDIICISETRLKNEKIDYQKNLVNIPSYDLLYTVCTSTITYLHIRILFLTWSLRMICLCMSTLLVMQQPQLITPLKLASDFKWTPNQRKTPVLCSISKKQIFHLSPNSYPVYFGVTFPALTVSMKHSNIFTTYCLLSLKTIFLC